MPFGVSTAPGWFWFIMNQVLRDENLKICVIYLDDVVVLGNTVVECWKNTLIVM